MAQTTTRPARLPQTPVAFTTRRGFAAASFSLGLWGLAVYWWYPFGMAIASFGILFGVISLLLGFRSYVDHRGENLALLGIGVGTVAVSMAVAAFRFMQVAFEGATPMLP